MSFTPFSIKDTQWETFDFRQRAYDVKSFWITPKVWDSKNEIAKRLGEGDINGYYDTSKTYSTNFSVFNYIQEHTLSNQRSGRSSMKKNICQLKRKKLSIHTKAELERTQTDIKDSEM
jgi:hypothetical protein